MKIHLGSNFHFTTDKISKATNKYHHKFYCKTSWYISKVYYLHQPADKVNLERGLFIVPENLH